MGLVTAQGLCVAPSPQVGVPVAGGGVGPGVTVSAHTAGRFDTSVTSRLKSPLGLPPLKPPAATTVCPTAATPSDERARFRKGPQVTLCVAGSKIWLRPSGTCGAGPVARRARVV